MLGAHLAVNSFDLGLGLRHRCPRSEPPDDCVAARVTLLHLRIGERQRLPNFSPFTELATASEIEKLEREIKARGHDADDGEAFAVEQNFCAENLRITIESALPQPRANDDDIVASGGAFAGFEDPACQRRDSERRKHSGRYRRPRSEERRVGKECRSRWSPY